jgi:hypothetical protein
MAGYSVDEYVRMYDLSQDVLGQHIGEVSFKKNDALPSSVTHIHPSDLHSTKVSSPFELMLMTDVLFGKDFPSAESMMGLLSSASTMSREVRIYPLLDEKGVLASAVGPLMLALQHEGYGVEIREVAQGSAMLRVWPKVCVV